MYKVPSLKYLLMLQGESNRLYVVYECTQAGRLVDSGTGLAWIWFGSVFSLWPPPGSFFFLDSLGLFSCAQKMKA